MVGPAVGTGSYALGVRSAPLAGYAQRMVRVTSIRTNDELLHAIGPRPAGAHAVALVGGADGISDESAASLSRFFRALARAIDRLGAVVIDGGTDSGVMRMIAEAREGIGATFRLIGVAPGERIDTRTRHGELVEMARDHPEVILVPGNTFGDETPWLFRAADHLAGGRAPTLVVNGGRVTFREAVRRLGDGGRVIAVAGSGRAADVLALAERRGGQLPVGDPIVAGVEGTKSGVMIDVGGLSVLSMRARAATIARAIEGRVER